MSKPKEWPLEDERILLADSCVPGRNEHSLWNFVRFAAGWHYRAQAREAAGKGLYWLTNDVHRPFIDWLQRQIDEWMQSRKQGKQERFQVLAWLLRGFGKTNLVTTCLSAYIMLDDPDLASYIGSETHPKAKEFLTSIKPMLDGSDPHCLFTWFYGNWYNADRTWSLDSLVTAHRHSPSIKEPSIGTFGVETGIVGKHPQLLIYDDPISDEKLKDGGSNWLTNAISSLDAIHPCLTNDSLFILIGTRYLQHDVIGTVLENEGVDSWDGHNPPAGTPFHPDGSWRVYFLQGRDVTDTKEFPEGRPVIPKTWSHAALKAYEAKNPARYRAQIMGDPMNEKASELTPDFIESLFIERKDLPPIEYATIHLDTAFKLDTRKRRGDYNVIEVWLHDAAPTGCVNFDGAKIGRDWSGEEFDRQLINVMQDLKRRHIRIRAITDEPEPGGKRGLYLRHLQDIIRAAGLRIPEIFQFNRAGTIKEVRIHEAGGFWIERLVRLIRGAENVHMLTDQMRLAMIDIRMCRHDDLADASADVFRPEIYRGRRYGQDDEAPFAPTQPGDDVLKGRVEQELDDIVFELRTGRKREDYFDEDPPPQPEVHEAIRPW